MSIQFICHPNLYEIYPGSQGFSCSWMSVRWLPATQVLKPSRVRKPLARMVYEIVIKNNNNKMALHDTLGCMIENWSTNNVLILACFFQWCFLVLGQASCVIKVNMSRSERSSQTLMEQWKNSRCLCKILLLKLHTVFHCLYSYW